ncbi:hypothetical protein N7539_005559 [Penicillium diatomitis]|uniref:Protein kinase domain-containing protein n=1 Tax=Penicillium diatomitis TaxID=2819901 RepID=A0A9W9X7M7_9EURO|nr:uncharacterized protein N7539_005559 [Penicillium diatomitis]KAJ5485571.1 hypothetical protein N7539_005559 [Penicillium diatomitis]
MDAQRQFPDVHWIWAGGISFAYEVHPRIVVKVAKSGEFERGQFRKELKVYEIFSQHTPCLSVVQCFFYSDNGITLESMRGGILTGSYRPTYYLKMVTKVEKLELLALRREWMNDLARAVALLESLNLAHGDLQPENILLDRDRVKLSDFDCTAEIGTDFEACMAPYGRILNVNETDQGGRGTPSSVGPRTEQFALGSLYNLINYGFEVYGDRRLTEDPREHGPKVVDLLQDMEYPKLNGDPLIDDITDKCWHNKYATVAELAAHTKRFLVEGTNSESTFVRWRTAIGRIVQEFWCGLENWLTLVRPSTINQDGSKLRLGQWQRAKWRQS